MTRLLPLLALVVLFVQPLGGGDVVLMRGSGGAAGCNEFTETTWDNLNNFIQDNSNAYSADATNDELDVAGSGGVDRIHHVTNTTNNNNCVAYCLNSDETNTSIGLIARGSTSNNANNYVFMDYLGDWAVSIFQTTPTGADWSCDAASSITTLPSPDAGDCIAACVRNTGASTIFEIWHWDEGSLPGNCRADWPTSTSGNRTYWTQTDCGSCCNNDSNLLVGIFNEGSSNHSSDDFVGGDAD